MKALSPLAALALGALSLTGCVTSNFRATTDGGATYREFAKADAEAPGSCPLRACVLARGAIAKALTESYRGRFSQATMTTDMQGGKACDIGFRFKNIMSGDSSDIVSAYTGETLFHIDAHFAAAGKIACAMLSPDQPVGRKLLAQRAAAGLGDPYQGSAYASSPETGAASKPAVPPASTGLSAADIERIARAVQSASPAAPAAASLPASPVPRFTGPERSHDLAVIVGIESYSDIASKAPYAVRDAEAFKAHVRALGVPERNITLLTGSKAVRSALTKNIEGWLPRMAKADSRVYFYFSGHGAPDVKTGQAYLVPWDGDPNFLEETAYPVAMLYKKLGALPAKQVLVAMDSCFSGAGGRSVLASGARPLVGRIDTGAPTGKLTVLAASASNEISGSLDDKGHGAFTFFLIEGLNAGKTTPRALADYLTPRVQDEARRLNRDQTPQMQGDGAWSLR